MIQILVKTLWIGPISYASAMIIPLLCINGMCILVVAPVIITMLEVLIKC